MSLTIEQILAADEPKPSEVAIPEWGGSVFVRQLSALESVRLAGALQNIDGDAIQVAQERLVHALSAYLCNAQGETLASIEQARVIAHKSAAAVNRIVTAGHRMNAVDTEGAEVAAKNLEPSRADSSPTG